MEVILPIAFVVVGIALIFLAVNMAKKRGRNPATWGILTFFFGIFAVGALAIMGPAKH